MLQADIFGELKDKLQTNKLMAAWMDKLIDKWMHK